MIIKEIDKATMNASESTKSELNSSNESSSASSTTTPTIAKQPIVSQTLSNDQEVLSWHSIMLSNISLGCGAYSKVKEAYDLKTNRKLAIKIIDCLKASKEFQERFLPRELKIWPNLIHPNIIRMHKYLVYGTKIYMILECAELGDMLDYLRNLNRNLAEAECKYWMRQLCSAICYLHNRNIIHRDIKLENLLIDANRCLKLCDFGFTKMLTTTTTTTTTTTESTTTSTVAKVSSKLSEEELSKTYCGSKAYASPEILLGQPYDPRKSDIWAIGCILFILITRKMPFDEELTHQNILKQQKSINHFNAIKKYDIDKNGQNLLRLLLKYDWQKRTNINCVVRHRWFKEQQQQSSIVDAPSDSVTTTTTTATTTTVASTPTPTPTTNTENVNPPPRVKRKYLEETSNKTEPDEKSSDAANNYREIKWNLRPRKIKI